MLTPGQVLTVTKEAEMLCRRDQPDSPTISIPRGEEIIIVEEAEDREVVRFSAMYQGRRETLITYLITMQRCCLDEPAASKAE